VAGARFCQRAGRLGDGEQSRLYPHADADRHAHQHAAPRRVAHADADAHRDVHAVRHAQRHQHSDGQTNAGGSTIRPGDLAGCAGFADAIADVVDDTVLHADQNAGDVFAYAVDAHTADAHGADADTPHPIPDIAARTPQYVHADAVHADANSSDHAQANLPLPAPLHADLDWGDR
jgi:hypothetical protein